MNWGGWTPIRLLYPRTLLNAGSQLSSDADEIRHLTVHAEGWEFSFPQPGHQASLPSPMLGF